MIEIVITEAEVMIADWPVKPGGKVLIFKNPQSGIQISVPLDQPAAKAIAAGLGSGLIIANGSQLPPERKM